MEKVKKTTISVFYESTDITQEINADLLSFRYEDQCEDEADSVSITLKDETGKWAGSWSPDRGAKIKCSIKTADDLSLDTGLMVIDTMSVQGAPRTFDFQAISIPLDTTIRRTAKSRKYENVDLKTIARDIARDGKLELFFDSAENPEYDKIDQLNESDLKFLQRLCKESGLSVKVNSEMLIIFDQLSYEKKDPILFYGLGVSKILRWSFQAQQSQRYRACTVKWRNLDKKTVTLPTAPATVKTIQAITAKETETNNGEVDLSWENRPKVDKKKVKGPVKRKPEELEYTYVDESVDPTGQVFLLKKRCTSLKDAQRLAKNKLRELNLRQTTGSLSVIGDPRIYAGTVVELWGFGSFDGNFIVESATHTINSSGYITDMELRRCNNRY